MPSKIDYIDTLMAKIRQIAQSEGRPSEEMISRARPIEHEGIEPTATGRLEAAGLETARLEAVIQWSRPILFITQDMVNDTYSLGANHDMDAGLIAEMDSHRVGIDRAIPAVGRIELFNNTRFNWAGTGWLVDFDGNHDIVLTNAHVANVFAQAGQKGFVF